MIRLKSFLPFAVLFLTGRIAFAQQEDAEGLKEQFVQFQLHHFQEKLFLHVAKTFYLAGETIWFTIYELDGYYHKPLSLSRIAYVEVLDKDQRPVLQAKIEMKDSRGSGSFSLPVSLGSGHFKLRAYTSWMKNFSPDYYFEQPLTIVNTLREVPVLRPRLADSIDVQFFPEGGNLVTGLESVVGFKAVGRSGEGTDCQGVIINHRNDTVVRFRSLHFGMGRFSFKPVNKEQYTAIVKTRDMVIRRALPEIQDEGYVMGLREEGSRLKISVFANIQGADQEVFLLAHTRQLIKTIKTARLNASGEATFYIDRAVLGEGVSAFTLFNSKRQPVCERLYCKRPERELSIEVNSRKTEFTTRDRIDLDILATDQSGTPVSSEMSMSVFMLDSLQNSSSEDIRSYLLLASELKGKIQSPSYYFDQNDPQVQEALDNLMLTQGWRRFRWEEVMMDQKPYFDFMPETEGIVIKGKISSKVNGQPGKNIMAYLSVPGKKFNFTNSVSDSSGRIRFFPEMIYGNSEIITALNSRADSNYSVDIQSSFSDLFSAANLPEFDYPGEWRSQLLDRSINMQVENTYRLDSKHRLYLLPQADTTQFYGYADREYYLDEYTRFKTMEEVMREYVADVRVRKESDKYYFRVNNTVMKEFFDSEPLVLLDGVPVFDLNRIMEFNPLKIQKIDVVAGLFFQGSLANTGIVSYQTYEGDLAGFELDPGSVVVEFDGIQRQRQFYAPQYDTESSRQSPVPDFRNLLFWSPEIRTGTNGKSSLSFYSSDLPGQYAIMVQGITVEGIPGSRLVTIDVKRP